MSTEAYLKFINTLPDVWVLYSGTDLNSIVGKVVVVYLKSGSRKVWVHLYGGEAANATSYDATVALRTALQRCEPISSMDITYHTAAHKQMLLSYLRSPEADRRNWQDVFLAYGYRPVHAIR